MMKIIQMILAVGTIVIGIYMAKSFDSMTAPFISGIGFIFVGFSLWMPHCPICKYLGKLKGKK